MNVNSPSDSVARTASNNPEEGVRPADKPVKTSQDDNSESFLNKVMLTRHFTNKMTEGALPEFMTNPPIDRTSSGDTNGWNESNEITIIKWHATSSELLYVHSTIQDWYSYRKKRLLVMLLLATTISSMVSLSNVFTDTTTHPLTSTVFSIMACFFSAYVGLVKGYDKAIGISDKHNELSTYTIKVKEFVNALVGQTHLPKKARINALELIMSKAKEYNEILNAPKVKQSLYRDALKMYKKSKENMV